MKSSGLESFILRYCLTFLAILLLASGAFAQSTTDGAIGGAVTDPSGAAVPNAKVIVKNNGTNAEQTAMTDESGYFRVAKLTPAIYAVTISASGFADFKAEQVTVDVGRVTELSAKLSVASAGATVLVSSELPQINTTSPDFGPIVDQAAVSNLPINGGRWSDFALLTPGVVNNSSGFGLLSFRGISTLLNNNTVDGADNNQAFFSEERGRTRAGYSSAKAAVEEFQVNTSNYSAEYGRAAGAVINTVTKSGTNHYHGEAYFFDRDNEWGATNPFTKITTQTSPGVFTSNPIKPTDVRKIWGGGIGGPIFKDKLFFFFAFDRYTRNFPGVAIPGSAAAFFAPPLAALTPAYTVDGTTNCFQASGTSNINRNAFIPPASTALTNGANIFTATTGACTLFSNLSLANYAAGVTTYDNGLNGLLGELGTVPRKGEQTIFFPKIDWQINSKNRASFEANRMRWASPAGIQTQSTVTFGAASFGNDFVKDTWGVAKLYTFITSTLSNEARYQYGRDFEFEFSQAPSQYELSNLVNPPGYTNPLGLPPDVFITNGFDMGVPTFLQRPAFPDETRNQFADTISWTHAKHALKFGVDFVRTHDLSENLRIQYGSFNYTSIANYVSDLNSPNQCTVTSTVAPNPPVTSKIPCYSRYQQAFGPLGFAFDTDDIAVFAEDSWRVWPRFTLNLGLRYEYEKLPSPFSNLANPALPQASHLPSDTNNLGPRIGFAWDIFGSGKTSLRGGYGMYFGRIINSAIYNALISTGSTNGQLSFNNILPTAKNANGNTVANPAAPRFPRIIPPSTPPPASAGLGVIFFDPRFQAPQIYETDLTLERQLPANMVLSVSYLGSFGRELPDFVDTNISPSTSTITYNVGAGGPLKTATYTATLFKGPRPNLAFGSMTDIISNVNSKYNALTIQLNRRMTRGVQFNANYTWSHSLDFGQNESTFTDTNDLFDPFNIKKDYGNSNFNVPNRFVFSAIAESPWHTSGWTNYLVSGWQIAPIYQIQNGLPFSLVTSGNPPAALGALSSGVNGSGGRLIIDVVGRNTFRLPRTQVVDLRISKKFTFAENYKIEVLGEGFNLFNHINVTGDSTTGYFVGGTAAAPTLTFNAPFGTTSTANSNFAYSSRQIQIGVRFLF